MGVAIPARGAPLPPSGSTAYTGYFACHHLEVIDMGESGSQTVTECIGITRNISDPKLFDNMSVRCLEDGEVRFGYKFTGWCAHTDGDGDKLFTSYTGSESGPVAYMAEPGNIRTFRSRKLGRALRAAPSEGSIRLRHGVQDPVAGEVRRTGPESVCWPPCPPARFPPN